MVLNVFLDIVSDLDGSDIFNLVLTVLIAIVGGYTTWNYRSKVLIPSRLATLHHLTVDILELRRSFRYDVEQSTRNPEVPVGEMLYIYRGREASLTYILYDLWAHAAKVDKVTYEVLRDIILEFLKIDGDAMMNIRENKLRYKVYEEFIEKINKSISEDLDKRIMYYRKKLK